MSPDFQSMRPYPKKLAEVWGKAETIRSVSLWSESLSSLRSSSTGSTRTFFTSKSAFAGKVETDDLSDSESEPPTPTGTIASIQAGGSLHVPFDWPPDIASYTGADSAGIGYSRTGVTASRTAPSKLPSQVEETLAACPRFRILLVGNTGVGKSSLISYLNIISKDWTIDIAQDRVRKAFISHEYYSDQNPRFILHNSMGFEPGDIEKSEIVKSSLRDRADWKVKPPDQVHAIWLLIETPRKGARLLQTGVEDLLELAKKLNIPVIVVLTKYDLLVMEHYRACSHKLSVADKKVEATKHAKLALSEVTKELMVPFGPVTTRYGALKEYGETMLVELMQVTMDNLRDEKGSMRALWATTQQINARLKVELSISEGFKSKSDPYYLAAYWRDLGDSVFFQGYRLVDCIARIHDDVLKIWNFNDPAKVLSGEEFFKGMMKLVDPLSDKIIRNQQSRADGITANVVTIEGGDDSSVVLPALGTIIKMKEFQFLRNKYQKGVSTAIYLAAYIVDLTLVLHLIFTLVTANPPQSLSWDFVKKAQVIYKFRSPIIHAQVKEVALSPNLEEKIAIVIWGEVGQSTVRTIL